MGQIACSRDRARGCPATRRGPVSRLSRSAPYNARQAARVGALARPRWVAEEVDRRECLAPEVEEGEVDIRRPDAGPGLPWHAGDPVRRPVEQPGAQAAGHLGED